MVGQIVSYEVSAFYKFVALPNFAELRSPLRSLCLKNGIKGTILLASEGINGTIAGEPLALWHVMAAIRSYPEFSDLEAKTSQAPSMPFQRMKVRLKKEIVTLGVEGIDPTHRVGQYISPEHWNDLIADPEVLVIDTRNEFEVAAGTFRNAIDPKTRSFGDFPAFVREKISGEKHRKIAMFCTGGIRCEKATSFMLNEGFENVFHLKGGILKYLETVAAEESLWQGDCFVFDERVALGHGLAVSGKDKDK
jgi:UPF0176 protein